MAYGSFGSGFTEGMASGASMADKWIGAYNNAKTRAAYEAAAQNPQEPDFTPDSIAQQYHIDSDTAQGVYNQIKADPKNGAKILNALNTVSKGGATGAPAAGTATAAQPDAGGVTTAPVPSPDVTSTPLGGAAPVQAAQPGGLTPPSGPAAASGELQGVPTIGAGGNLNYPSGRVESSVGALVPPSPAVAPPPSADVGGTDAGTSVAGGPAAAPQGMAPTSPTPLPAPGLLPDTGAPPTGPQTGTTNNPFDTNVTAVMGREGGYNPNDAGKGPTNYGINQSANPDVDVSKLTPDQAKALYKQRYWDPIGGDKLPANMQSAAFDAAVNQGVPWTQQALAEANGDLNKFNDLRRARYQQVAKNPDKAKYLPGWLKRVDEASQPGAQGGEGSGAVGDPANSSANLAIAPPAVQQQALQTPGGQAKLADDLKTLSQINERTFVDPRTQFTVGADGKITRQGPVSDADRYLRMSRVAVGLGDAATAKAAMDMHITAKAQEAQDYVDNVMKSDLSDDDKIGALTHSTGIKAYKVGDGQYVVPALTGAPDANGQYKRVGMTDIANWSKQIATPEGIKALYSWQHQEREDALNQQKQDFAAKKEGGINVPGSEAWERLYGTYAKFMKQPGTGKEAGNMAEAKPGESFNVQTPQGTFQMASVSNLPGMTADVPGLMRQSEIDHVTKEFPEYQKNDSRFNAKSGNNIISPVANPLPWNPATKTAAQSNDPTSGTFTYRLTGKNPANGKMDNYAIGPNGEIKWGVRGGYRSYEQAKAAADKFDQLTHSGAGSSGGKSTPEEPAAEAPEASNAPSALTPPKYAERTPVYGD